MNTQQDQTSVDAVNALVEQAQRFGLLWRIIPATVIGDEFDVNSVILTMDGDSVQSRAVSLVGLPVEGDRVMVLVVPPGNLYIIGWYGFNGPTMRPGDSQAGSESVTVAAATSATKAVTFATPYPSGVVPAVSTNIDNGTGATSGWGSRAINITNTGFTIFIFGSSSSFTATVYWQSQRKTQ